MRKKAIEIRNKILEMGINPGGHITSSFSCVEILVALYYGGILKFNPKNPEWQERDRFIMSKGHGATGLYAVLADLGFFPSSWIKNNYKQGDCRLGGHPDHKIPGVEITSGSLGHGLGIAAGNALAAKMDHKKNMQYVLMGDAECTEGSVWEAALFASKHKLSNLVAIIDRNHIGSLDFTKNFTKLEPFTDKWESFGWEVININGHNFDELLSTFNYVKVRSSTQPILIGAETIKGKDVSFMENDPIWHVKQLTDKDEIRQARKELQIVEDEIK